MFQVARKPLARLVLRTHTGFRYAVGNFQPASTGLLWREQSCRHWLKVKQPDVQQRWARAFANGGRNEGGRGMSRSCGGAEGLDRRVGGRPLPPPAQPLPRRPHQTACRVPPSLPPSPPSSMPPSQPSSLPPSVPCPLPPCSRSAFLPACLPDNPSAPSVLLVCSKCWLLSEAWPTGGEALPQVVNPFPRMQ